MSVYYYIYSVASLPGEILLGLAEGKTDRILVVWPGSKHMRRRYAYAKYLQDRLASGNGTTQHDDSTILSSQYHITYSYYSLNLRISTKLLPLLYSLIADAVTGE